MKRPAAVLIADVIQSTRQPHLRAMLTERLRTANAAHLREKRIRVPYAITAGDEFQVIASAIECVPELIFDLRRRMHPLHLRIGVGIGRVRVPIRTPVNRLAGEAFLFARRAIEDVKRGTLHRYPTLTAFHSSQPAFDGLINLVYGLNDTLVLTVTDAQWRAIDTYFAKKRVDRTARALKIDSSTASRSLRRGHYWQLAEVAESLKTLLRATRS